MSVFPIDADLLTISTSFQEGSLLLVYSNYSGVAAVPPLNIRKRDHRVHNMHGGEYSHSQTFRRC